MKKRFRLTVVVSAILFLLLVGVYAWRASIRAQVARQRAAAAVDDAAFEAMQPTVAISPESNAYTYVISAEPYADAAADSLLEILDRNFNFESPLSDEAIAQIAELVPAHPEVFAFHARAAAADGYDADLDEPLRYTTLLPHVDIARKMHRLAWAKSQLHLSRGEWDQALRIALEIFKLARHIEQDAFLVCHSISCRWRRVAINLANQALRGGPTSLDLRNRWDRELAAADSLRTLAAAMRSERRIIQGIFQQYRTGPLSPPPRALPIGAQQHHWAIEAAEKRVVRFFIDYDESLYLKWMAEVVRDIDASYPACMATDNQIDAVHARTKGLRNQVTTFFLTNMKQSRDRAEGARARQRCLRILLASIENGELPRSISLQKLKLPASVTTDPFTQMPLRIKPTSDGVIVYSFGPNQTDQDGELTEDDNSDIGLGPPLRSS